MADAVSDATYAVTAEELKQFIERFEHLDAEKRDIADQMKEVMAEAKGRGYDTKALRKIKRPSGTALTNGIRQLSKRSPEKVWRDHVEAVVANMAGRGPVP